MLTCRELVELVTDYLEDARSAPRQREVHDHLLDCADCLRYLGQIQLTSRLLDQFPPSELTDEGNEALSAAFGDVPRPPTTGAGEHAGTGGT